MQFEFDCAQDTRNALMLRTWRVMGSLSLSLSLGGLLALLTGSAAALIPVRSRALLSTKPLSRFGGDQSPPPPAPPRRPPGHNRPSQLSTTSLSAQFALQRLLQPGILSTHQYP
jgi:hypothetical protein